MELGENVFTSGLCVARDEKNLQAFSADRLEVRTLAKTDLLKHIQTSLSKFCGKLLCGICFEREFYCLDSTTVDIGLSHKYNSNDTTKNDINKIFLKVRSWG